MPHSMGIYVVLTHGTIRSMEYLYLIMYTSNNEGHLSNSFARLEHFTLKTVLSREVQGYLNACLFSSTCIRRTLF